MKKNKKIIAYTGLAGSGKTTSAKKNKGYTILSFANPLRKMCFDFIGFVPNDYDK